MERIPKKLKDAFQTIRRGNLDQGLKDLDAIKGCENQKAMALAEIAYFQHDWAKGLELSRIYMPNNEEWHYSNIFDEHVELVLLATYKLNAWKETEIFLKELLKKYKNLNEQMTFQIKKKLSEIEKKTETIKAFEESTPQERTTGKTLEEIEAQQKKFKPKLNDKEIEKADYILYFLNLYGKTKDFINLYEKNAEKFGYLTQERAAIEYMSLGKVKEAQKAIMLYARCWYPIEIMQVEPVTLMTNKAIIPALDKDLCAKIIKTPKGPAK